jgi:hypothetical protein
MSSNFCQVNNAPRKVPTREARTGCSLPREVSCNSLLCQLESREWLGFAFDYIVEPVLPAVDLGVVDESVGEAGLTVLIGEDESKLILFGRGEPDGLRCCSAVHIHPHAGVLLGLLIPADEYRRFVLRFAFVVIVPRDFVEAQVRVLEHQRAPCYLVLP